MATNGISCGVDGGGHVFISFPAGIVALSPDEARHVYHDLGLAMADAYALMAMASKRERESKELGDGND